MRAILLALLLALGIGEALAQAISVSPSAQQLPGTGTNGNANAGNLGQLLESTVLVASSVSLTDNAAKTVTSITLTPGDWDVWGTVAYNSNVATVMTVAVGALNTTTDTLPTIPNGGGYTSWVGSGNGPAISAGMMRVTVAAGATTVVYLIAYSRFTVNVNAAYGYIGARRRR